MAGKKVLEIGCGIGTAAARVSLGMAQFIQGVRLSKNSLDLAKKGLMFMV